MGSRITAYTEQTAPADDDLFETVDISDTSQAPTGTNKKVQSQNLIAKKIKTTTGPTVLSIGAVADGEVLTRSGASIIGAASAAPAAHATAHEDGGSDEIGVTGLSGVLADPQVADKVKESSGPTTLTVGAVADGEILKRSGSAIIGTVAGAGGVGDVVGPGSAVDNALARFDSTTGKLIQNSTVTLDDTGALTVPEMAAPSTPASGKVSVYAKADGKLYIKDDAGTESDLTATAPSGAAGGDLSGPYPNPTVRKITAPVVTVLTDAATIATDASLGNTFRVTLGGNRTLGNPTNAADGQVLSWEIIQDGTGSRTLALDTKFAFGTDITSITLTTTASKRDFLTAIYNSGTDKFYVRAFVKGY